MKAAATEALPLRYYQMDTNTAQFPEDGYDLVVNFAAGHHVARLDRVFRRLAEMLPEDGIFVSWEYIGPHRNQYSTTQWEAAWQINKQLPAELRQELNYPHLPTMLATDPTEAIHSELIVETLNRYFESIHDRALGGAVGYPLLTFNGGIHSRDPERVFDAVTTILEADAAFTDQDPRENTLFAYIIARPNKVSLQDGAQLAQWSKEENEREAAAARSGGAYYPPTMLAELFEKIYAARDAAKRNRRTMRNPVPMSRTLIDTASGPSPRSTRPVAWRYPLSPRCGPESRTSRVHGLPTRGCAVTIGERAADRALVATTKDGGDGSRGAQVTVVVVTWQGAHLIGDCLASLGAQTTPHERACRRQCVH